MGRGRRIGQWQQPDPPFPSLDNKKDGDDVRRFRGEGHHKVDGKGRVSIPASFRRVLESGDPDWTDGLNPNLVIVYGDHRRSLSIHQALY